MERRHDIDWLRIIAILLVLYFHTAMLFAAESGWHIKNAEQSNLWLEFNFWLSRFRMPLLFFVSGYGTFLALRKRSPWQYVKERNNRLMVPLLFAVFVIVPPQIYFERQFNGANYSSFFSFYPKVLELVPYPEGNFSWHHMWFVLYLFVYSVVCLPLFLYIRSEKGKALATRIVTSMGNFKIAVIMLPTVIIGGFWAFWNPDTHDLVNDLPWHFYWCSFFVAGYLVGAVPSLWDTVELHRRKLLGLAILCIVVINFFRWNKLEPWDIEGINPAWEYVATCILAADAWLWLLAASGYAKRYLNKHHPIIDYANRAIYPFYILHQTVIIAIGYYVIQVQESILAKYLFVSTLSLIGSLVIYEYLIRPFRIARFLFGVKELKVEKTKPQT
ncbi:acyltransferase family protein [uncultured Imperialibacter sp.]|uniref:acyltransferase family protein n=1 Tax=uncultured Imperialibacter sp. TaxID=1672639 RepID=UPI0030DCE4CC